MEVLYFYVVFLACLFTDSECSMSCSKPNIPGARVTMKAKGKIAMFSCRRAYQLYGVQLSTCVDGNWQPQTPKCAKPGCKYPERVSDGTIIKSHKNSVMKLICSDGFEVAGADTIFCDGRLWSDPLPYCIDSACASVRQHLSFGDVHYLPLMNAMFISCHYGFSLHGPQKIHCRNMLQLEPKMPSCEVSPIQYKCDFESDEDPFCGWNVQITAITNGGLFFWSLNELPSSFPLAKISDDHTPHKNGTGHYIYLEKVPTDMKDHGKARVTSQVYTLSPNATHCFIFWYYTNGFEKGALNVFVNNRLMWQESSVENDQWYQGFVPLPSGRVEITIEGSHQHSSSGLLALDDFLITNDTNCGFEDITTRSSENFVSPEETSSPVIINTLLPYNESEIDKHPSMILSSSSSEAYPKTTTPTHIHPAQTTAFSKAHHPITFLPSEVNLFQTASVTNRSFDSTTSKMLPQISTYTEINHSGAGAWYDMSHSSTTESSEFHLSSALVVPQLAPQNFTQHVFESSLQSSVQTVSAMPTSSFSNMDFVSPGSFKSVLNKTTDTATSSEHHKLLPNGPQPSKYLMEEVNNRNVNFTIESSKKRISDQKFADLAPFVQTRISSISSTSVKPDLLSGSQSKNQEQPANSPHAVKPTPDSFMDFEQNSDAMKILFEKDKTYDENPLEYYHYFDIFNEEKAESSNNLSVADHYSSIHISSSSPIPVTDQFDLFKTSHHFISFNKSNILSNDAENLNTSDVSLTESNSHGTENGMDDPETEEELRTLDSELYEESHYIEANEYNYNYDSSWDTIIEELDYHSSKKPSEGSSKSPSVQEKDKDQLDQELIKMNSESKDVQPSSSNKPKDSRAEGNRNPKLHVILISLTGMALLIMIFGVLSVFQIVRKRLKKSERRSLVANDDLSIQFSNSEEVLNFTIIKLDQV